MSVVYESRSFMHDDAYPMDDPDHDGDDARGVRYPGDSLVHDLNNYNASAAGLLSSPEPTGLDLGASPTPQPQPQQTPLPRLPTPKDDMEPVATITHAKPTPSHPRIKAIPKPDREVVKNLEGKYLCTWPNCTEDVKEFNRKCEWNKHMDKHDRPYKCPAEGCEKLPGFTYSGGLLRHEREVHGKHGGPKNPLNCPHPNCKRHSGKGFSRQENLNEHLRRVHTNGTGLPIADDDEQDDNDSVDASDRPGEKRKADDDLRDHVKRLQVENDTLKEQVKAHNVQAAEMMRQITALQATVSSMSTTPGLGPAPQAPMLDDDTHVSHAF